MVRLTSAADINSRSGLGAAMGDLDLLLRLSGRIVKGRRTAGQPSTPRAADAVLTRLAA
jgi:hypothetical protein